MGWLSKAWNAVTGTIKAIISNPVTAIAAVGMAIYAPALGLRMLSTMMISNVLNAVTAKDPSGSNNPDGSTTSQAGNTQMIPARTTNKLPAVYGKAFLSPILVDAKISTDNQTMWYVGALCEAPTTGTATISFGKVLWDGQIATFSGSEAGRVTKLTNAAGQEDTKIDGNLWMYFYNGSGTPINGTTQTAYQVLQDTAITSAARWTGNEKMNHTVFVIIKLVYSTDDAVTGLPGNLQIETNIYQNGVTDGYKPGSAMLDYLTNDRFGAGLSSSEVHAQSFYDLDTYADQVITFTPTGGGSTTQPRYRFNGMVDTTASVMSNWMAMAECSDSYIQYNESLGKWSIIANKGYDQLPNSKVVGDLFSLTPDNIIGGINITPLDLNSTPNSVESNFFNYKTYGQSDSVYADTPQRLQNYYEPPQRLTTTYRFVNDYVRAQYLSNRRLEQCRADYIVDLTTDYSAITVDAGDVVLLTYEPYGGNGLSWTNKPFRVTQVQEQRGEDGSLTCKLQLSEYSAEVYDNYTIQDYNPPLGNYVLDPALLAKPAAPTIPDATILPADTVPSFVVKAVTPASGMTVAMEFWYGPTDAITDNNYKLYETQYNSSKAQYGVGIEESVKVTGLPEGTWFWRVRAIGTMRKSEFSDSAEIIWAPAGTGNDTIGDASGKNDKTNMALVPWYNWAVPSTETKTWPDFTRGMVPAGGTSLITQAAPGSIHIHFSTTVWSPNNSTYNFIEIWKSTASKYYSKKGKSIRHSYDVRDYSYNSGIPAAVRIQIVGEGMDYISDDGGLTWSIRDSNSTTTKLNGCLPWYGGNSTTHYRVAVAGDFQPTEDTSSTPVTVYCNVGDTQLTTDGGPIKLYRLVRGFIHGGSAYYISVKLNDFVKVAYTAGLVSSRSSTDSHSGSMIAADSGMLLFWSSRVAYDDPVGDPSRIYSFDTAYPWIQESTGTLQNLYAVYANDYNNMTSQNWTAIAVGGFGTIIKSNRTKLVTNSWSPKNITTLDGNQFINDLYGIAGDNSAKSANSKWVAVGQRGSILLSTDDGETWTEQVSNVTGSLNDVKYGNGKWIAVGDGAVILVSTDGVTWNRQQQSDIDTWGYSDRNFYSIDYSTYHNRFNISGDACILTSSGTIINFSRALNLSADESYSLTRIWNRGAPAVLTNNNTTHLPTSVNTAAATSSQLINGQTVSSTIIDTDYKKGDELTYYLVVGNNRGSGGTSTSQGDTNQELRAGGSVITAVEYKRAVVK